jgi:hypothetical protein
MFCSIDCADDKHHRPTQSRRSAHLRTRRGLSWDDRSVFVSYGPAWGDQTSSWWAKVNRAREHLESARELVQGFRASQPYSVLPEPTDTPGKIAYRLQIVRPVPVATVGDMLHNLRGALESLAFEVARRSQAMPLTPVQERASTFPICDSSLPSTGSSGARVHPCTTTAAGPAPGSPAIRQSRAGPSGRHRPGTDLPGGVRLVASAPPRCPVEPRQAPAADLHCVVARPVLLGEPRP